MIQVNSGKQKERKTAVLSGFLGVDRFNHPLNVSKIHAHDMRNFINEGGINHKRHGWEEKYKFPGAINGFFQGKYLGIETIIVYAGTNFYKQIGEGWQQIPKHASVGTLSSRRASFYVHGEYIYIIGCGDYLYYDGANIRAVADDEKTYVPLTYIGDYVGSERGLSIGSVEDVNMLSIYRRNVFYDENIENGGTLVYRVDAYDKNINEEKPVIKIDVDNNVLCSSKWQCGINEYRSFSVVSKEEQAYKLIIPSRTYEQRNYLKFSITINGVEQTRYILLGDQTKPEELDVYIAVTSNNDIISSHWLYVNPTGATNSNTTECTLVKTGWRKKLLGQNEVVVAEGAQVKFAGTIKSGTSLMFNSLALKFQKTGESDITLRWKSKNGGDTNGDWNEAFLTDGTNVYALSKRKNFLYKYNISFGLSIGTSTVSVKENGQTVSKNVSDSMIIPGGYTLTNEDLGDYAKKVEILLSSGEPYQKYYGYTLVEDNILTSEGYQYAAVGTVSPYDGEVTFYDAIEETWGGIGDEKKPTIEVRYAFDNSVDAAKIQGAKVSTLFGLNGNTNRLFVTGNDEYPNVDWHSGYSSSEKREDGDFTYFPDTSYAVIGTEATAIMGYQRLSDKTLAIFKEASRTEPTIYIRSGATETDSDGNYVEYYPNNGGYFSEGAVNSDCFAVLGADKLMVSKNGVFGMELSENIAAQERFLRERSKAINEYLAKEDLSMAVAIVYQNRYYLAVNDKVFIADARYTRTERSDMSDTFNYEWWIWNNCPVRIWFRDKEVLCFGTDDGRICSFGGGYEDKTFSEKYLLSNGDITIAGAVLTVSNTLRSQLKNGMIVHHNDMYDDIKLSLLSTMISATGTLLTLVIRGTERGRIDERLRSNDKVVLWANGVPQAGEVEDFDKENDEVRINVRSLTEWNIDTITTLTSPLALIVLSIEVKESILTIENDGEENEKITLRRFSEDENDIQYDISITERTTTPSFVFETKKNVVSEWTSGAMNFGTDFYVKQLEQISTLTEGVMDIGFESRIDIDERSISVGDEGKTFSLENFDLARISLRGLIDDISGVASYTRHTKKTFSTLVMRIVSDNSGDCVLHEVTFIYKLLRRLKGAR